MSMIHLLQHRALLQLGQESGQCSLATHLANEHYVRSAGKDKKCCLPLLVLSCAFSVNAKDTRQNKAVLLGDLHLGTLPICQKVDARQPQARHNRRFLICGFFRNLDLTVNIDACAIQTLRRLYLTPGLLPRMPSFQVSFEKAHLQCLQSVNIYIGNKAPSSDLPMYKHSALFPPRSFAAMHVAANCMLKYPINPFYFAVTTMSTYNCLLANVYLICVLPDPASPQNSVSSPVGTPPPYSSNKHLIWLDFKLMPIRRACKRASAVCEAGAGLPCTYSKRAAASSPESSSSIIEKNDSICWSIVSTWEHSTLNNLNNAGVLDILQGLIPKTHELVAESRRFQVMTVGHEKKEIPYTVSAECVYMGVCVCDGKPALERARALGEGESGMQRLIPTKRNQWQSENAQKTTTFVSGLDLTLSRFSTSLSLSDG